jgi:hypothetical protein
MPVFEDFSVSLKNFSCKPRTTFSIPDLQTTQRRNLPAAPAQHLHSYSDQTPVSQ